MDNLKLERCWACDEFTGNAGNPDDSLYDDEGGGPYCSDCWNKQEGENQEGENQEGEDQE